VDIVGTLACKKRTCGLKIYNSNRSYIYREFREDEIHLKFSSGYLELFEFHNV